MNIEFENRLGSNIVINKWIIKMTFTTGCMSKKLDLTTTTPAKNFGCNTPERTLAELCGETDSETKPISVIFGKCLAIAEKSHAKRIVNFGLGEGSKLIEYFESSSIQMIGINDNHRTVGAQGNYSSMDWLNCDLTDYNDLEYVFSQLETPKSQTFLFADGLEHLRDPRPLLRTLKRLLMLNPDNRLLLSTLDREKNHGHHFKYIPPDIAHYREWSFDELLIFLSSSGFIIEEAGYIESDNKNNTASTLIVLSLNKKQYNNFLIKYQLPPESIEYLICSTEHGQGKYTGGIGSYVEEMESLFPKTFLGVCLLGEGDLLPEKKIKNQGQWILPASFFEPSHLKDLPTPDLVLQLVEQVIYFHLELKIIEYQDYYGIGLRVAQAKCSGLLPPHIKTKVRCHGTLVYMENAFQKWIGLTDWVGSWDLHTTYLEKIAIETSDIISFPTSFLCRLYNNFGYEIDREKIEELRYPFDYAHTLPEIRYKKIDTLIFFGRRTSMKGFPLLGEALELLFQNDFSKLKRLILLGAKSGTLYEENAFINSLHSRIQVIELAQPREEAIRTITSYANNALCIIPYPGDNHPVSVLEVLGSGCQLLAANAGGIPELIPNAFHPAVLCEPDGEGIALGIGKAMYLSAVERYHLIRDLFDAVRKEQHLINNQHLDIFKHAYNEKSILTFPNDTKGSVTVIVPCYNTHLDYIEDLIFGLNNQSMKPEKVIFIDDGSKEAYKKELQSLVSEKLFLPFEILKHHTNQGLPAARNTGLKHTTTDYFINIDSDNIPKTDLVKLCVNFLKNHPDVSVITTFPENFDDKSTWEIQDNNLPIYWPHGASVIMGQITNFSGDGTAGYNTQLIRSIGGWDDSDKSMWEDWSLFLKVISCNMKIGVIPRSLFLYRVRPDSMLRNYKEFPAQQRLARNTLGITRFDAFRLQGIMRDYHRLVESKSINFAKELENLPFAMPVLQELEQYPSIIEFVQELKNYPSILSLLQELPKYPFIIKSGSVMLQGLIRLSSYVTWANSTMKKISASLFRNHSL